MRIITLQSDPTLGRFNEPKKRMSVTLKHKAYPQERSLHWFLHTKVGIIFEKNLNKDLLFVGFGLFLRFPGLPFLPKDSARPQEIPQSAF